MEKVVIVDNVIIACDYNYDKFYTTIAKKLDNGSIEVVDEITNYGLKQQIIKQNNI